MNERLAQSARFSVPSYMHSEIQHPFKAKISETFAGEPSFRKLVVFCVPLNVPFALCFPASQLCNQLVGAGLHTLSGVQFTLCLMAPVTVGKLEKVFLSVLKSEVIQQYKTWLNWMKIRLRVYPKYSLINFIFNFMIGMIRI